MVGGEDRLFPIRTTCVLLERYDFNQLRRGPGMLHWNSHLATKPSCQMLSKYLEMSRKIAVKLCPLFNAEYIIVDVLDVEVEFACYDAGDTHFVFLLVCRYRLGEYIFF